MPRAIHTKTLFLALHKLLPNNNNTILLAKQLKSALFQSPTITTKYLRSRQLGHDTMDKETARKAKYFLARREVSRLPEPDTVPDIRPKTTPAHILPLTSPPDAFARNHASIETANKARNDEEEKNNQSPASDVATHGSVADDAQGNVSKGIKHVTREQFERLANELEAMDKKERDALFPHHKYISKEGVSAEVAFKYLMDTIGSI